MTPTRLPDFVRCDILSQIGFCLRDLTKCGGDSLTAPLRVLDQDPEYQTTRLADADRVQELQKRIAPT